MLEFLSRASVSYPVSSVLPIVIIWLGMMLTGCAGMVGGAANELTAATTPSTPVQVPATPTQGKVWAIGSPWSDQDINAAISSAADGDMVQLIGSGSATWTNAIKINKAISLTVMNGTTGAWAGNNRAGTNFPITVTSNASTFIAVITADSKPSVRISGFRFQGGSSSPYVITIDGDGLGDGNGAYRIDNNWFDHVGGTGQSAVIQVDGSSGELTGVIDNNIFDNPAYDAYSVRIRETSIGSSAACYGYDAWQRPLTFGSDRFNFIEDNLFSASSEYQRHSVSSDGAGGKYVVRHNIFVSTVSPGTVTPHGTALATDYIDAHGDGTQGLGTGSRGGEIYGNTFLGVSSAVHQNIGLRGGEWLVYDNTFTTLGGAASPIHLTEMRASATDCWEVQSPSQCWQGVPQCATASMFNGAYPLPGQIRNTFVWNNTYNGTTYSPVVDQTNYVQTYIAPNRDYWVTSDLAAAKSSGLNAGYAPFTYPHPLRTPQVRASTSLAGSKF
jgi:hypothetical protein